MNSQTQNDGDSFFLDGVIKLQNQCDAPIVLVLDHSWNKFGKCIQMVWKEETRGHHYYTVQIKQRSFSHIILRLDVNLGEMYLVIFYGEGTVVSGGKMGQFSLTQMWLSSGHISWIQTSERIKCVWFLQVGILFLTAFKSRRKCATYHVLKGQWTLLNSVCLWFILCLINKRFLQKYGKYPHPKLRKKVSLL